MYKNLEALLPRFAEYFHNKFGQEKGQETIMNLGITDMKYFPSKNILWVETSRPGYFIGRKGEQINELEKFLTTEILLEEAKSTITDRILFRFAQFSPDYLDEDKTYSDFHLSCPEDDMELPEDDEGYNPLYDPNDYPI